MRKISGAVQLLNCAGDFLEIVGADRIRPYGLSREAGSVHLTTPHFFVDFSNLRRYDDIMYSQH